MMRTGPLGQAVCAQAEFASPEGAQAIALATKRRRLASAAGAWATICADTFLLGFMLSPGITGNARSV